MNHEVFISRCITLAKKAGGNVLLNPNVGAVLAYKGRVIGEGYHEVYGGPHAEVNAINCVAEEDKKFIKESTLYVSLEPCNFHGKTPACSELILKNKITNLVVGCEDPNPMIAGKSLAFLESQGVKVTKNVMKESCEKLIQAFKVNILSKRPFVTIKYAQSKDFFISRTGEQTWLSNEYSKVWSHQLRSLNHGILIGANTGIIDNPALTNRLYTGSSPLRICIDPNNKIADNSVLLTDENPTLIVNREHRKNLKDNKEQWSFNFNLSLLLERLYKEKQIGRLIVEGGAYTIQQFLDENLWDKAFVINTNKKLEHGVKAPTIIGKLESELEFGSDKINCILNNVC